MRIGIDARMYAGDFTGIGRYTYELIRHLLRLDTENEYIIFLRGEEYDRFQPADARVKKILAEFQHYSWGEQIGFLRLLNQERLDLMHFTHFNAPIFYRRPYVVTIHDLTLSFFPGKKMTRLFHRLAYQIVIRNVVKKARAVIAVSQNTKNDLETLLSVPSFKIKVIYHGIDRSFGQAPSSLVEEAKKKYNLSNPYFLYTGVWRDHKNITGMIRAFGQSNLISFDLVMTGREDPFYPEVKQAIQALGLISRVRLVGLVPDEELKALYQGAYAYIFPSFYEGFGFPPLEAMASGVPVLASRTSSIPEICGEGNALYFDPHNIDDMSKGIRKITEDAELRDTLVERGKRHVQQFQWDKMAQETFSLYKRCV